MWAFVIHATVEWQSWKTARCWGEKSFDFSPHCYCKAKYDYANMYFSGWIEFNPWTYSGRKPTPESCVLTFESALYHVCMSNIAQNATSLFFFLISCHPTVEKQNKLIMTPKGSRHCLILQLVLNFITWTLVGKMWNWMDPTEFILYVTVTGDYSPILIKRYFVANCERLFQNSLSHFHSSGKG